MRGKTEYLDIWDSNRKVQALQLDIMMLVDVWVKNQKTPVPRQEIIRAMKKKGKSGDQIDHALSLLIRLQYIRKAISATKWTSYVQLRRVDQ